MTTVLQYLVIAAVIGLVVFGLAVFVFGRGEQLAPLSPRTSPTELPDHGMAAQDVRKIRFAMALRGYRMSDVDWALDKMADEIDRLRAEVDTLSAPSDSDASIDSQTAGRPSSGSDGSGSDGLDNDSAVLAGAPGPGGRHQIPGIPNSVTPSQKDTT